MRRAYLLMASISYFLLFLSESTNSQGWFVGETGGLGDMVNTYQFVPLETLANSKTAKVILSLKLPAAGYHKQFQKNLELFHKLSKMYTSVTFIYDPFCHMIRKGEEGEEKWIFVNNGRQEVICKKGNSSITFPKEAIYKKMAEFLEENAQNKSLSCRSINEEPKGKGGSLSTVFLFNNGLSLKNYFTEASIVLSMGPPTSFVRNSEDYWRHVPTPGTEFIKSLELFLEFANKFKSIKFIYDPFRNMVGGGSSVNGKWIFNGKTSRDVTVVVSNNMYSSESTTTFPKEEIYEELMAVLDYQSSCQRSPPPSEIKK